MAYGLTAIGHYYFKATIGPFNSNNFLGSIFLPRLSGTYETWPPHQEHRSFAYERKDYETAYKLILPLAEQGYAEPHIDKAKIYETQGHCFLKTKQASKALE